MTIPATRLILTEKFHLTGASTQSLKNAFQGNMKTKENQDLLEVNCWKNAS